jgi:hypothetical protein
MATEPSQGISPFYSRAYGGFTAGQEDYYLSVLGNVAGKMILDPMAGQGYSISRLAGKRAEVWLGDINPAPLLLASLRSPEFFRKRAELIKWVLDLAARLSRRKREPKRAAFHTDWISPQIRSDLNEYGRAIGLGLFSNPFSFGEEFWNAPLEHRFAASIPVLAARALTCFRSSDNLTWLKPGGLTRERSIYGPVKRALLDWCQFIESLSSDDFEDRGAIFVNRMDAEKGIFGRSPLADGIVTSPPYANRLDYTRMWAPETEVLAAMSGQDPGSLKVDQIGSTVVSGREGVNGEEAKLPKVVQETLDEIRKDPTEFSETYYYPFFRNYAVSLARSLRSVSSRLKPGGTLIIFVRDTVRKDVLFPTGELVSRVLTSKPIGLQRAEQERRVIKNHIGFLRKGANRGFYGLAQQEWWQVFRKGK